MFDPSEFHTPKVNFKYSVYLDNSYLRTHINSVAKQIKSWKINYFSSSIFRGLSLSLWKPQTITRCPGNSVSGWLTGIWLPVRATASYPTGSRSWKFLLPEIQLTTHFYTVPRSSISEVTPSHYFIVRCLIKHRNILTKIRTSMIGDWCCTSNGMRTRNFNVRWSHRMRLETPSICDRLG